MTHTLIALSYTYGQKGLQLLHLGPQMNVKTPSSKSVKKSFSSTKLWKKNWKSVLTSSTNVCGDQDLFLAISEAVDDSGPLFHLHLTTEQRHLVALSGQLPCQPPCSLSCLNPREERAVNYLLNMIGLGLAPIVTLESVFSNNMDLRYALCCFIDWWQRCRY